MTTPTSVNLYGIGVGTSSSIVPYISTVSPTSSNIQGPNGPFKIGQIWVNSASDTSYILNGLSSFDGQVTATWVEITGGGSSSLDLTGNSGGAVAPTAGNINTVGAGSITIVGNPGSSTLTTQLTGLTAHNLLVGEGTSTVGLIPPSSTVGYVLTSNGASADPTFQSVSTSTLTFDGNSGTATPAAGVITINGGSTGLTTAAAGSTVSLTGTLGVPNGGTGDITFTAYMPITGGTTLTGDLQSVSSSGSAGQVLTYVSSSALPTWQSVSASLDLAGNSGGDVGPTAGVINTIGSGSITIVGNPGTSTLVTELTGLTAHNVLIGEGTTTIGLAVPSSTAGVPLVSNGSTSDPIFSTAVVAGGGTGVTSFTAYAPICGGTSSTGNLQSASSGISNSGYVLTSTGSLGVPTWQALPSTSLTFDANTGSATPSAGIITINGGTTGLTTSASGSTVSLTGTLDVANGGTGVTSSTAYSPICGGTTSTGAHQSVSDITASAGQVLTFVSTSSLPTWQTVPSSSLTFDANTGSATPSAGAITINGGLTGLTTSASGSTLGLTGTLIVGNGGTGDTTFTSYAPVCGGVTTTGALQSASSGITNSGYVLTSTGATSLPTWQASNGGVTSVTGTTNQITVTPTTGAVVVSFPSSGVLLPGSLVTTSSITGGTVTGTNGISTVTGNVTINGGDLVLGTTGSQIQSAHVASNTAAGANSFGTVALVAGTATVNTTSITANSMVFLTCQSLGTVTTPSALAVTAKTAGGDFTITASQSTDTSTIAWFFVN